MNRPVFADAILPSIPPCSRRNHVCLYNWSWLHYPKFQPQCADRVYMSLLYESTSYPSWFAYTLQNSELYKFKCNLFQV